MCPTLAQEWRVAVTLGAASRQSMKILERQDISGNQWFRAHFLGGARIQQFLHSHHSSIQDQARREVIRFKRSLPSTQERKERQEDPEKERHVKNRSGLESWIGHFRWCSERKIFQLEAGDRGQSVREPTLVAENSTGDSST